MFENFGYLNIIVLFASVAIGLAVTLGMMFAFRTSMSKTAQEIQDRVIATLETQINSLNDRVDTLEKENTQLTRTMSLIRSALKRRGLIVSIDGDMISILDINGNGSHQRINTNNEQGSGPLGDK